VSHITYLSQYHAKTFCTVDDGTGTIECAFRISEGGSKTIVDRGHSRDVRPSAREPTDASARPDPVIPVGSVVKVQGKVRVKHNSRELNGDTIGLYFPLLTRDAPERESLSE
jgi:DNA/RNA endonuclease YhcR with UshA esterase domain